MSFLAVALALTCVACVASATGCRREDAATSPNRSAATGAPASEQVGTTTSSAADVPITPATSVLDGVGGGLAPGMPASFPRSSGLLQDRTGARAPATTGTPATALDSTVVPAPFVNRAAAELAPSEPLVAPGLENTTNFGYQGPTGGAMRPGAASNPDTTSGAR